MSIWLLLVLAAVFLTLGVLQRKKSKARYKAALAIAAVLLLAAAVSGYFAWSVGSEDHTVTITLEETPSTGYAWNYTMEGSGALLETKNKYKGAFSLTSRTPGKHIWEFVPKQDGSIILSFRYSYGNEPAEDDKTIVYRYQIENGEFIRFNKQTITALLESLPPVTTGLNAENRPYILEFADKMIEQQFYEIKAIYTPDDTQIAVFYVPWDMSSVYRVDGQKPILIYGMGAAPVPKSTAPEDPVSQIEFIVEPSLDHQMSETSLTLDECQTLLANTLHPEEGVILPDGLRFYYVYRGLVEIEDTNFYHIEFGTGSESDFSALRSFAIGPTGEIYEGPVGVDAFAPYELYAAHTGVKGEDE